jgi:DNA mismatch endonuclease (patch repair protein)
MANREWWRIKIQRTIDRDRRNDETLTVAGWRVIRIWEHENPCDAADRVVTELYRSGCVSAKPQAGS